MDGEAVREIRDLAQMDAEGSITNIGGEAYSTRQLHHVPKYFPTPGTLMTSTLTGLVDLLDQAVDSIENAAECYFLHVVNCQRVEVVSPLTGPDDIYRHVIYAATFPSFDGFPFGQWLGSEEFIIKIRSLFAKTDSLAQLLQYVGKLSVDESITTEDDGISQRAVLKSGISGAIPTAATAPVFVRMAPYRTFREIEQPESEFLFRMRKSRENQVQCALFESDGGQWQLDAIQTIAEWLRNSEVGDFHIIA